jgi:transglutaminase-like putative cysteine protease
MSATVADLPRGTARTGATATGYHRSAPVERPVVRIVAFAALGLYGVLRWSTLMVSHASGRLLGLLALTVLLGAVGPAVHRRARTAAVLIAVAAFLVALPLAGLPLAWVVHLRVAVSADAIGQGLSALPRVLVPYSGVSQWVDMVITLGAAVLLLDAGLLLAFAPPSLGDARRAGVALPLIALAVVPSTLLRPQLPYLQGLLLFILIAAFMWGERIRRQERSWALVAGTLAAVAAMLLAPSLDERQPWINYRALAGALAPTKLDVFDWTQRYGPLNWPQIGQPVLDVQAPHADYWKAENLDGFNGRGWVAVSQPGLSPLAGVSRATRARFTQTIHFTLRTMSTSTVIAAGTALQAPRLSTAVVPGSSPGTWTAGGDLGPGDSYTVTAYSPHPTAVELARASAGSAYAQHRLAAYRSLELPGGAKAANPVPVVFPPFHSAQHVISEVDSAGEAGATLVGASPYAPAYRLAQRLASRAATPYAFVTGVKGYLAGQGFTYDQNPPLHQYPLLSFLFDDKLGYCQQFAGAMALLLRMGGLPARVATGFTTGTYQSSAHQWVVSDIDAHAWVEVWFPHYGWVRFDPTPAVAPARGSQAAIVGSTAAGTGSKTLSPQVLSHATQAPTPSGTGPTRRHGASSPLLYVLAGLAVMLLAAAAALTFVLRRHRAPAGEALVAELERALARSGRPIAAGTTLAALEQRLRSSPEAAGYVRTLRLARFGGGRALPTPAQRRALRAHLAAGLGLTGAIRALWALPPGRGVRQRRRGGGKGA